MRKGAALKGKLWLYGRGILERFTVELVSAFEA